MLQMVEMFLAPTSWDPIKFWGQTYWQLQNQVLVPKSGEILRLLNSQCTHRLHMELDKLSATTNENKNQFYFPPGKIDFTCQGTHSIKKTYKAIIFTSFFNSIYYNNNCFKMLCGKVSLKLTLSCAACFSISQQF